MLTPLPCSGAVLVLQIAAPFGVAEFDIMYGRGINALGCVLDAAEVTQVVERKVRDTPATTASRHLLAACLCHCM